MSRVGRRISSVIPDREALWAMKWDRISWDEERTEKETTTVPFAHGSIDIKKDGLNRHYLHVFAGASLYQDKLLCRKLEKKHFHAISCRSVEDHLGPSC